MMICSHVSANVGAEIMGKLLGVTIRNREINNTFLGKNCLNENIFQRDSKMISLMAGVGVIL